MNLQATEKRFSMLLYIAFLPASQRTRALWIVMCAIAACYYGG